jgi:hypothetical protein
MRAAACWLALVCTVTAAQAEAPVRSLVPQPRPQIETAPDAQPSMRPRTRPTEAAAPVEPGKPASTRKGSVCKNNNIKGTVLKPITSRTKGCGIKAPVLVSSVNGVRLSPAATLNCDAAEALSTWIDDGLQPAFQNQVTQLDIAASYVCRTRNNKPGGRISEHATGNAIDISGFVLSSGKTMTVANNYGRQIRAAQKAACGTFRTTLGPGSDGYHESHIHLDVSKRGGSAYCR